jgi:hypothetical protein
MGLSESSGKLIHSESEMADEGGGEAAFRAAKKGEGKCQRSAEKKRRLFTFDQHHARCARPSCSRLCVLVYQTCLPCYEPRHRCALGWILECRTLLAVRFLCNARIRPEVLTSTLHLFDLDFSVL